MKKGLLPIIAVIIVVIGLGVYGTTRRAEPTPVQSESPISSSPTVSPATTVFYDGENGKTALELLQTKYRVEVQDSSYGAFVTSINGLKNTDKKFWLFYVNGTAASEGAGTYETKNSQQIEWRYQ